MPGPHILIAPDGLVSRTNGLDVEIVDEDGVLQSAGGGGGTGALKYTTLIGNGSATTYTVTHDLGDNDIHVQLWSVASDNLVMADVVRLSSTQIRVDFGHAPATNSIKVVVIA